MKLLSIAKFVLLCDRQNIPLRGHRDDSKWLDSINHNPGNFQSILDFIVVSGDMVLKEHFQTSPQNAIYRFKTIQNELIEIIGEHILECLE